jgi:hypothetical protein
LSEIPTKSKDEVEATRPRRLLWIAVATGLLMTAGGMFLALVAVSVIPRGEGPRATALVGGGEAEAGGVTLRIGDYTISAGDPQYAGSPTEKVQAACGSANGGISGGEITKSLLPLTIEPTGVSQCVAEGGTLKVDHARLIVQVDKIGIIQAKPASPGSNPFLPLSKVNAEVQKTSLEIWTEVGVLVLLASGPALIIGALIPLLIENRKIRSSSRAADVQNESLQ